MLCLIGSWITAEAGFDWTETHFLLGYTSLGLVLFRVVWGFVGTTHARFGNFLRGPKAVLSALGKLFSTKPADSVGHNPLGGWSTVLLIALVGVQAGTGLFISDDIFYAGPYNGVISSDLAGNLAGIHHLNFTLLQVFVGIHIASVLWYQFGKRSKLINAMWHGRKTLPQQQAAQAISSSRLVRALLLITIVAVAVTLLVQLAPPPPVIYDF